MTLSLEAERKKAEETLTLLAAADAAKKQLEGDKADGAQRGRRRAAELAQANTLLSEQKQVSAEGQRQVALLNQQTAQLREQLNSLQGLLDASAAKDIAAQVQIDTLGSEPERGAGPGGDRGEPARRARDQGEGAAGGRGPEPRELPLGVLRQDAGDPRRARGRAGGRRPLRLPLGGAVRPRLGDARRRGPGAGGAGGAR